MNKRSLILISVLILISASLFFFLKLPQTNKQLSEELEPTLRLTVSDLLSENGSSGFDYALHPRPFVFPQDHGPHPTFRNEWWYITGNLFDKNQNRFSYQLTFFRQALTPVNQQHSWKNNTITMAHFALSNHQTGQFIAREKWGRDGAGVAGAQSKPFRVWLDDWSIQSMTNNNDSIFPITLHAKNETQSLQLTLSAQKPITLQGKQGLSQKSEKPGNASYYYSFTRLNTTGTFSEKQQTYKVQGHSWLDREWSSSALSKDQQGWNWFAFHLANGDDLMFYQLLQKDGTTSPFSDGIIVTNTQKKIHLSEQHITLIPLQYWRNKLGQLFPVKWKMKIHHPDDNADWIIQAPINNQWLNLSVSYWEGAIDVLENKNQQTAGYGFLEMTRK